MIKSQRWTKNELTNELPNSVTNLLMEDVSEGRISTIEMRSHLQRCVKTRDCGAPPLFLIMLKHPSWNSSFKSIPWNVFKCTYIQFWWRISGAYPAEIRRISAVRISCYQLKNQPKVDLCFIHKTKFVIKEF